MHLDHFKYKLVGTRATRPLEVRCKLMPAPSRRGRQQQRLLIAGFGDAEGLDAFKVLSWVPMTLPAGHAPLPHTLQGAGTWLQEPTNLAGGGGGLSKVVVFRRYSGKSIIVRCASCHLRRI